MLSAWTQELIASLQHLAADAGFDRAGVAPAPAAEAPEGQLTAERFSAWIAGGHAGEMEYLKRKDHSGELLRRSARNPMPWARSVVVCALNYNADAPRSIDPAGPRAGWIGRYAWSGDEHGRPTDYHDQLLAMLHHVESGLHTLATCETRCYVDTGPLLERDFAARAGIGWVGKNTCVIDQTLGSWLLLGVIVTSLPIPPQVATLPAPDRCGSCTRCLDACPTHALTAPRAMDASLCIAYLTIEKKGLIPEPLRQPIGRQVFGCDICQDVCPWNRKAPIAATPGLSPRAELVNPDLAWLAQLDQDQFRRWFKGSPLERTKRHRLLRNVAIAMGNSGRQEYLPQLQAWAAGEDTVLASTAAWAITRLSAASIEGEGGAPADGLSIDLLQQR